MTKMMIKINRCNLGQAGLSNIASPFFCIIRLGIIPVPFPFGRVVLDVFSDIIQ